MCKFMSLIRLIILSLFIFTQTQADTIYNLIKIPNLEIYDIKTPNKLRYLYAKQPFTPVSYTHLTLPTKRIV